MELMSMIGDTEADVSMLTSEADLGLLQHPRRSAL